MNDTTDPSTMTEAARDALLNAARDGALLCHWRVTGGLVRRGLAHHRPAAHPAAGPRPTGVTPMPEDLHEIADRIEEAVRAAIEAARTEQEDAA